ncbi:MAG: T9SS type A sorting domain-containing protein [Bacteroidia bacterium]|nr:T9SS type A sorting domain-containing protein [Bacteroidia bacterium]
MKTTTLLLAFFLCAGLLSFGQSTSTVLVKKSITKEVPERIRNSKQFMRAEWFYAPRAFPYDTIPATRFYQEADREMSKAKSGRLKSNVYPTWAAIGPRGFQHPGANWGIVSGRVRAIAVHPTNPSILYIGAASGGIWKSIDGGTNWSDVGYGMESMTFGAIAIDPKNPETVYAGSGESVLFVSTAFPGKGLFKSTDGGQSWTVITNGIGNLTHFSDLEVSPYNSNIILATLASGYSLSGGVLPNEGIWRSIDGGTTWSRTLDLQDAFDIAFHPADPSKAYAAIGGTNGTPGFFISNDQGATWVQSNSGLLLPTTGGRMQFDIAKSDPNIIYAVIFDNNSPGSALTRAFKSVNGGNSWVQISAGTKLGGYSGSDWYDQGDYDLCIAVDPVNPNHVLIGNVELHRTTNGSTFEPVRPFGVDVFGSLVHCDYHKLIFAPSNPNILYIGCDGGIYKSSDKGYTATSLNKDLSTLQFYRIASHPSNPGIFIGGMQDNGGARTADGGTTWYGTLIGDVMECFFDRVNPDNVYTSRHNGILFKSVDGGVSFALIFLANGSWITPFFMHPTNNNILYTANKKILKSTNAGLTFEVISGPTDISPVNIGTLAQSQVNPNNMILTTGFEKAALDSAFLVKVSTDEGSHWTDVTANIPGEIRWISRVVTDPVDANTMYVLRTGFSPGNKVYKTTDLGQTWTNISGDLPDLPCNDLFIDPENTNYLFLANDIGIYLSNDGGTSWNYASQGMPVVLAADFDYVKIGNERLLRIGTYGRSVFEANIVRKCQLRSLTLSSQAEVDNFATDYPYCQEIGVDVTISGSDIKNVAGLSMMSTIGGAFTIQNNPLLTSLEGLEGVTTLYGDLVIEGNPSLKSLKGLRNIDPGSIANLIIRDNDSLSVCEVLSVCSYLASPGGSIDIQGNAPGCNSEEEIKLACLTSSENIRLENEISIFPNPGKGLLVISAPNELTIQQVAIYNSAGQKVHQEKPVNNTVDISKLRPGMYFIEIRSDQLTARRRFVVE